jgi:NAD(P)-dependent dehydrogenase (short-subunit alcohol dehydrogenase family)
MDLHLNGKIALVTGASRGIGLAIARALVAEGATVVGAARTATPELKESGAETVEVDLSTPDGPPALVAGVLERHGHLDLLVNNAGGGDSRRLGGVLDYDDDLWREMFELNLFAAVRMCRAAVPSLVGRRGLVVNISSMGARMPQTGPVPYNAAKAALNAYGKALAEEYDAQGLRVVTVSPGPTRTPLWTAPDGFGAAVAAAQGVPLEALIENLATASGIHSGRLVEPEDVGAFVAFLASPMAASMTGHEYLVDGGAVKEN